MTQEGRKIHGFYRLLQVEPMLVEIVGPVSPVRGVEYHKAYDLGMPRLSCIFCVFAPKAALKIAAKHNPELYNEYCRVEEKIGHTFRKGFSLSELKDNRDLTEDVKEWNS